jgi:hypothetical protein
MRATRRVVGVTAFVNVIARPTITFIACLALALIRTSHVGTSSVWGARTFTTFIDIMAVVVLVRITRGAVGHLTDISRDALKAFPCCWEDNGITAFGAVLTIVAFDPAFVTGTCERTDGIGTCSVGLRGTATIVQLALVLIGASRMANALVSITFPS